jgi:hypothetical protein
MEKPPEGSGHVGDVPEPQPVRAPAIGWTERLGRAAILAIVASLGLALAATQLLAPQRPSRVPAGAAAGDRAPSATPSPSAGGSPVDARGSPSPLPDFKVIGSPQPTGHVLLNGDGPRLVDLATGSVKAPSGNDWTNQLFERPGGGYVCVCVDTSGAGIERQSVRLKELDSEGRVTRDTPLDTYEGRIDPDGGSDQGASVLLIPAGSPDGALLFIAHARRVPPAWRLGVDVVDVASARIVSRVDLGKGPSHDAHGLNAYGWVTALAGPDGRHVLFTTQTNEVENSDTRVLTHWLSDIDGAAVSAPRRLADGAGSFEDRTCRDAEVAFGGSNLLYAVCSTSSNLNLVVRRITTEGEKLPDIDLSSLAAFTVQARLANQIQGIVYLWDPFAWRIARVDLNAGILAGVETIDRKLVTGSAAGGGILDGLARTIGNWIAPGAAAKVYMDPALAFSPDGARIYALATTASSLTDGGAPSAGVLVLDATTLRLVGHWRPLADLISIRVSDDGRFVYAVGSAGGTENGDRWQASLTVYDASTGEVREVVGKLGDGWLMFPKPVRG